MIQSLINRARFHVVEGDKRGVAAGVPRDDADGRQLMLRHMSHIHNGELTFYSLVWTLRILRRDRKRTISMRCEPYWRLSHRRYWWSKRYPSFSMATSGRLRVYANGWSPWDSCIARMKEGRASPRPVGETSGNG